MGAGSLIGAQDHVFDHLEVCNGNGFNAEIERACFAGRVDAGFNERHDLLKMAFWVSILSARMRLSQRVMGEGLRRSCRLLR